MGTLAAVSGIDAPALRPRRIGELLDVAIKIYLRNWRTLFALVLVVAVPLRLLGLVIQLSTQPDRVRITHGPLGDPNVGPSAATKLDASFVTGQLLVGLIGFVVVTVATAACFKAIADAYIGKSCPWQTSLRFVGRRIPALVWLMILFYLGLGLAAVFLVVPAIWLGVAWSVALPVLLLEDVRGTNALGRSWGLVEGRWWATAATLAVGFLLASVVGGIIQGLLVVPLFASGGTGTTSALVAGSIARTASSMLVTPFQAAIVAVVYFDLRVRKEAFDLEVLAERLGLPVPEGAAAEDADRPGGGPHATGGPGQPPFWPPPPGWQAASYGAPAGAADD